MNPEKQTVVQKSPYFIRLKGTRELQIYNATQPEIIDWVEKHQEQYNAITTIEYRGREPASENRLTYMHPLPPNLIRLRMYNNHIVSFPKFPDSLCEFVCRDDYSLYSFPENILPDGLEMLICVYNRNLTSLPALPKSLFALDCSGNRHLSSLPLLPEGLEILICTDTGIRSLPSLPATVVDLQWDGEKY